MNNRIGERRVLNKIAAQVTGWLILFSAPSTVVLAASNLEFNLETSTREIAHVPHDGQYSFQSNMTLEFWMRRSSATAPTQFQHLIGKDDVAKTSGWSVILQSGTAKIRFEPIGVGGGLTSYSSILDTNWHHIAVTRDNGGFTVIYIDGNWDASANTSYPTGNSERLVFGNSQSRNNGFFGNIDEARIWNFTRPSYDINCSKKLPSVGNEANLVTYWSFDEGSGQVFFGTGSLALNGTLGLAAGADSTDPSWMAQSIPGFGAACDVTMPLGGILTPTQGSTMTISGLSVLSGTASDAESGIKEVKVTLRRNSDYFWWDVAGQYWSNNYRENLASIVNGTWTTPGSNVFWSVGYYRLEAYIRDNDFNMRYVYSDFYVEPDVETSSPTIAINSHVNNSSYTAANLTYFHGTSTDNISVALVKVKFIRLSDNLEWDGNTVTWLAPPRINNAYGTSNWDYTVPVSAWSQAGSYQMIATAIDPTNNIGTSSITFIVSSSSSASDTTFPTLTITHPVNNSTHPPTALSPFTGTAGDNNSFIEVTVSVKDLVLNHYWTGAGFTSPAETSFWAGNAAAWSFANISSSAWTNGRSYLLTAKVRDGADNFTTVTSNFLVDSNVNGDTIPPYVHIQLPVDGQSYSTSTIAINGDAGDNIALNKVEISLRKNSTGLYYDGGGFYGGAETFLLASGLGFWTYYVPLVAYTDGSYLLKAKATDTSGNTFTQSLTFTITGTSATVDSTPPTGAILHPVANSSYTAAASLTNISGTCADNGSVTEAVIYIRDDLNLYYNGNEWTSVAPVYFNLANVSSWTHTFPAAAWKNGIFNLSLRIRDNANNLTTIVSTFSITGLFGGGTADPNPPLIYVYNPYEGAYQTPQSFTNFNGRAEDAFGISQVKLALMNPASNYYNGATFSSPSKFWLNSTLTNNTATGADWSYYIPNYAYDNGAYSLELEARDNSNNISTRTINFTVYGAVASDVNPPTVQILSFTNNQTRTAFEMTLASGTAQDDSGLDRVDVKINRIADNKKWNGATWSDGEYWLVATGTSTWSLTLPLSVWADGNYTVTARAWDSAQRDSLQTYSVTISGVGTAGTAPTITITNVQQDQTYSGNSLVSFSGATDGTSVRTRIRDENLQMDWDPVGLFWRPEMRWSSATVTGATWSTNLVPTYWPNGRFKIMAEATGSSGLITTSEITFNVSAGGGAGSDFTAPAAISNLEAVPGTTVGSVRLTWTAPGDDGNSGQAATYTIKYSPYPMVTESEWTNAININQPPLNLPSPAPQVSGSSESLIVTNLPAGAAYYWGVRARDENQNRGPLSNSPFATAFSGCQAGLGDGEGSVSVSPTSLVSNVDSTMTFTFTVGNHGITSGGKILVRVPDGWAYPQTNSSLMSGYFTAATSNNSVTLTPETDGQMIKVTVNGTLNAQDTVTITHRARSYSCDLANGARFSVLSQASSCGIPAELASVPTVTLTASPASWLGFEHWEKAVTVGDIATLPIRGQNNCGQAAAVSSNVNIEVAALIWDTVNYDYIADTKAVLSASSDLSSSFTNGNITLLSGQSTVNAYYRLSENDGKEHKVRIRYLDLNSGSYQSENYLNVIPLASGAGITNVSIDTGVAGSAKSATFTPDADGVNDIIYFNYSVPQSISSVVEISNDDFATVMAQVWGWGQNIRVSWNGERYVPVYGRAPAGAYKARIKAAGLENTELSFTLQAVGVQGIVKNSATSAAIANSFVNLYGPVYRSAQTDSSGAFSFVGLPNGTYSINVDKQGFEPKSTSVNFSGSDINLGDILLAPLSQITVNAVRTNPYSDLWGSVRTVDAQTKQELWTTLRFAYGRLTGDNGYSTDKPVIQLKAGTEYQLKLDLPGFTATPLTKTLANGESYTWDVALTPKKGVSGRISLSNDVTNANGLWINISAGEDANSDGKYDTGYPTKFASAYMAPGEYQTNYSMVDLNTGTHLMGFETPGLSPEYRTVTLSNADITQDITLTKGAQATLTLTFQGDTTALDAADYPNNDGLFTVYFRYNDGAAFGFQSVRVNTGASGSSLTTTLYGLRNAAYDVFFDPLSGFSPTVSGPQKLTVANGTGSLSVTFAQDSGILRGTLTLASGSTMNGLNIFLSKDTVFRSNPTISGNQFEFQNLASGRYSLSIYDTVSGASRFTETFITNGQTTVLPVINLGAVQTYSISGTVRTLAGPPYDSLSSIQSEGTNVTYHTINGDVSVSPLRVRAQLINPDGSVDPLPSVSGVILNPTRFKYAVVDVNAGAYQIDGLESGKTYRVGLNTDLDNDGIHELPKNDMVVALTANRSGADFTIRDGGKISLTLTTPSSESNYAIKVQLTDTVLKTLAQEKTASITGTSATVEFANLQVGRYLLAIVDENTPVKYSAKPQPVNLDDASQTKSAAMTLSESGVVQLTLSNSFGTLVTAANASTLLPAGTTVKISNRDESITAALDSGDGKYKAAIRPRIDYTVLISPPEKLSEDDRGKSFVPVSKTARVERSGDILDLGVIILKKGKEVAGTVVDESGNPIARVPVLAYQSLSKNLAPLYVYTNDAGKFTFENLSEVVRFYDLVANPTANRDSLPTYSETSKSSIDISKPEQIAEIEMTLKAVSGSISGLAVSAGNLTLTAGFGTDEGRPGVSLLITPKNQKKTYTFLTEADGSFAISVPAGIYDVELIAQNHQPHRVSVTVSDEIENLGTLSLQTGGVNLSGQIRTSDGSLPTTNDIAELWAIDTLKKIYRASLSLVTVGGSENIDGYVIHGLSPNTEYVIIAADSGNRGRVLKDSYQTLSVNSTLDLTFTVTQPKLTANFILKIPEKNEIDIRFNSNHKFRNKSDDLDADGIADDDEMDEFVSITRGNGTLSGDSFSSDRRSANYTYAIGDETGNSYVSFLAEFKTEEIDPTTGDNYEVSGEFSQPLGILAQQTNEVNPHLGAEFALPDGAGFNIPGGAFLDVEDDEEGLLVKFFAADALDGVTEQSDLSGSSLKGRGAGAMALARQLGPKAYPARMYKAIQALESAPEVNPFSSFYDIFLPANVRHLFSNGSKPTLTLKYDESADPNTINIYYFNEAQNVYTIESEDRQVDTGNHTISVTIGHASVFTVLASSASIITGDSYSGVLDVFNFPNPFNLDPKTVTLQNPGSNSQTQNITGTMLKLSLPSDADSSAKIEIFNVAGELVKTLHAAGLTVGTHNYVEWDGTNDHGAKVASGVYIGRMKTGGKEKFFKMAVLK